MDKCKILDKVIEAVCAADEVFFDENPEIDIFIRPIFPGEFSLKQISPHCNRTLVAKTDDGVIMKRPVVEVEDML